MFPTNDKRFGVCFDFSVTGDKITDYQTHKLSDNLWYYDYTFSPHGTPNAVGRTLEPKESPLQYQMVWNAKAYIGTSGTAELGSIAATWPSKKWLIGNEPDVASQTNNTPNEYAQGYNRAYNTIKTSDPTALVYFGGIGQMSPMRMRWLTDTYNEYYTLYGSVLPCDGMHSHAYIIQETPGSGIGYAVGVSGTSDARGGTAWSNHTNFEVLKEDVKRLRQWMKDLNWENKPLVISEYGSLLPAEGWNSTPEVQGQYLQDSFNFFLTYSDSTGCPLDENRLVQEFSWFSLNFTGFMDGRLFVPELGELGQYYRDFYYSDYFPQSLSNEDNNDLYQENLYQLKTGKNYG